MTVVYSRLCVREREGGREGEREGERSTYTHAACTHTHTHTQNTHTHMHTSKHVSIHLHIFTCMQASTHPCRHTHTHTHTCRYTRTYRHVPPCTRTNVHKRIYHTNILQQQTTPIWYHTSRTIHLRPSMRTNSYTYKRHQHHHHTYINCSRLRGCLNRALFCQSGIYTNTEREREREREREMYELLEVAGLFENGCLCACMCVRVCLYVHIGTARGCGVV